MRWQDSQLRTSILVRWAWEERATCPRAGCSLGGLVMGKRHSCLILSLSLSLSTGMQFFHSLLCVLIQFLILRLMGRTITAVFTTFLFQMVKFPFLLYQFVEKSPLFSFALPSSECGRKSGDRSKTAGGISWSNTNNGFFQTYLMAGYYFTATEHYDIKWTMPHCVLTLKLIGELVPPSYLLDCASRGSGKKRAACSAHHRSSNGCFSPPGLAIDYYDGGKDLVSKTWLLLHSFLILCCFNGVEVRKSGLKVISY